MDTIPVPTHLTSSAQAKANNYDAMYRQSIDDPETFWREQANALLKWKQPFTTVNSGDFWGKVDIKWFPEGTLNVCENCLDRHLPKRANQTALIWEPDDYRKEESVSFTYKELHEKVCAFANVLKRQGVQKGDAVAIYLPMIPEAAIAMLACARIGALHSVVFSGFEAPALLDRIQGCDAKVVITADQGLRAGKISELKSTVDKALAMGKAMADDSNSDGKQVNVEKVIVVKRTGKGADMMAGRDLWMHEEMKRVSKRCRAEEMNAEDPLFILFTSGTTGAPKGVMHTTGGYAVHAALSEKNVLGCGANDVTFCTADVGWITGHSYVVYGPLLNGATTVLYEGTPDYPTPSRNWQIIDKHKVNVFYTAPTAIRSLIAKGDQWLEDANLESLRVLGSVGEPINRDAWLWYFDKVGKGRCEVIDTYWQTETGGHMLAPMGVTSYKPGAAMQAFYSVVPVIVDDDGNILEGKCEGNLCFDGSWPGMARTLLNNHSGYIKNYFSLFEGFYFTGDGCRRDADGHLWVTGRVDDVLNIAGHRLSAPQIESVCNSVAMVAESGVVACPDEIKGQSIYVFAKPMNDYFKIDDTPQAREEKERLLRTTVTERIREEISKIATPKYIQIVDELPKTTTGKIVRRILRKLTEGVVPEPKDIPTVANPWVIKEIDDNRLNKELPVRNEAKAAPGTAKNSPSP